MKLNIPDIRKRLSNNTAIDAKEIQALCDEVERFRNIKHNEFELDEAAQASAKEYGGAGSFKDGGLWMLDWIKDYVKD